MSYPDGYALKYEYDASNRLTKISDTSNALIASYSYDAAGRQTMKDSWKRHVHDLFL